LVTINERDARTLHASLLVSSFSAHDNTKFVSSGGDRSVFLWDVTTGNTIRRISAHLAKINVVEFNDDASVVASGKVTFDAPADGHAYADRNRIQVRTTPLSSYGTSGAF
jgi:WD40 repeat protein